MIQLEAGEQIIVEARKHWFAFLSQIFMLALAGFLPGAVFLLGSAAHVDVITRNTLEYLFLTSVWMLFVWIIFFAVWTNHHLDVLVITDQRIIDIEQFGLFSHDLAEVRYDYVQDVKVEVFGLLATIFNFGNVHVQTAAASKEFVVKMIPAPHKIKEIVAQQLMRHRNFKNTR